MWYYLPKIVIFLVVTTCYLVVAGGYCLLLGVYWWLLLISTFSMNTVDPLCEFLGLERALSLLPQSCLCQRLLHPWWLWYMVSSQSWGFFYSFSRSRMKPDESLARCYVVNNWYMAMVRFTIFKGMQSFNQLIMVIYFCWYFILFWCW